MAGGVAKGRSPRQPQTAGQQGSQQVQQKPTQQQAQARALAALQEALLPHHAAAQDPATLATDTACPSGGLPPDIYCAPAAPAHASASPPQQAPELQQQQRRHLASPEPLDRLRVAAEPAQRPAAGAPVLAPGTAPCSPMEPGERWAAAEDAGPMEELDPGPEPGSDAWEQAARQAQRYDAPAPG